MAKNMNADNNTELSYPAIADIRLQQLRFTLEDLKTDALVVTYLPNIRYLTNFSGTAATLFITETEIHFVTDDRYEEQIKNELYDLPGMFTHITRDVWDLLKKEKFLKNTSSIAFEADRTSYSDAVDIRNKMRPLKFKPAMAVVEPFTMPKSTDELADIQKACEIAEQVYEKMLKFIKPGITEIDLAVEIAHQGRLLGSEADAFPIIAVSGPNSAMVHGKPTDRVIKKGDIVLMDYGCTVNGFLSDITRTVAVGKATKEQKNIYKILHEAKEAAIAKIHPAVNGKLLDASARDIIVEAGYGDNFQHSLGHGIGLVPHERPLITFRTDTEIIPEDAVLAVEPGIYIPDKYGIRIEDNIHVTRSGGKHLTNAPEELPIV